jgi:hypothetical protein
MITGSEVKLATPCAEQDPYRRIGAQSKCVKIKAVSSAQCRIGH